MSIKNIDYLSPKISLFYNRSRRHKSNVGAILTIIMICLSGFYVFYLISDILQHRVSSFMFYKNYLNDAGLYFFNDTGGIFHYFQIFNYQKNEFGQFNSKYVRVFMSRLLHKTYPKSLSDYEHWVYDICRDGYDNKNIPKEIFDNSFTKGVCLRYYYDINQKKYFSIEDQHNFKYPYLIHGSGRKDNLLLETVIEKCDNNSIITKALGPCGDEKEMNEYLNVHKAIYFNLLENQVDTENYKKSIYQYLYSISGSLDSINVPVNNINLIPFIIEIKKGAIIPRTEKIITYLYDDNRKTTLENNIDEHFLAIFDYWLINSCQIIKGDYSTIYDILPNIGGIIQLIYYIFFSFNYLHNKYLVIQDCNQLFFKVFNKENEGKEDINIKKIFSKYVKSIREEIKLRRIKANLKRKSKLQRINNSSLDIREWRNNIKNIGKMKVIETDIKKNINIGLINKANNNNDENNISNEVSNSNDLIIDFPKNNIIKNQTNIDIIRSKKKILRVVDNFKNNERTNKRGEVYKNRSSKFSFLYYQFAYQIQEYIYHKNNEFKEEPLSANILSQYLTFSNYLLSLLGNENKKRTFFILNKFREKILSEENLFRTKIYLYHIERYFNIKEVQKTDILELYSE